MKPTSRPIYQLVAYYPPHLGGMENCAKEISERLQKKQFDVHVITSSIGTATKTKNNDDKNNLNVKRLPAIEIAHTPIMPTLFSELWNIPDTAIIHMHIAQAFMPEIVYLVSKLRKLTYIAHVHIDVGQSGMMGFLLPLYKKLFLGTVLRNAKYVVALNTSQKDLLITKYSLNPENVVIIPNGVDEMFQFERKIQKKKLTKLLFVGRLSAQKNILLLIRAIKLIKNNVELHIVGDGELKHQAIALVKDLGLINIIFHGDLRSKELISMYKTCDIFVLPSEREGFPLVLLEAMSSGMPILTNDIPEIREILDNSGMIIHTTTQENISSSIDYLINSLSIQKTYSQKAVIISHQYTWQETVKKIFSLYTQLS